MTDLAAAIRADGAGMPVVIGEGPALPSADVALNTVSFQTP